MAGSERIADVDARTLDAEVAVIGSLLIDETILPQLLAKVEARDFQSEAGRLAYQAARKLFRDGRSVDAISIRAEIGQEYSDYLLQCMEVTGTAASWREYADLMHEQAALTRIRAHAQLLVSARTLADCAQDVRAISDEYAGSKPMESWSLADLLSDFAARQDSAEKKQYVSYGMKELDDGTYTEPGDVVMLGGSPSDGKTALALMLAYHMAKTYNVGFFSLETGKDKLEDRLVASGFQIDLGAIKRGTMTDDDWQRFADGSIEAQRRRLRIFRASGATVEQITAAARAYSLDVIYIDYVQLIEPEGGSRESRAAQVAEISRALHVFAQSSKTLVVELAQLTRQSFQERKEGVERSMFDLGETSQFEKDADLILLLYRPPKGARFREGDKATPELDGEKGHRLLRVAKNKEGRWGRWPMYFDGAKQTFRIMQPDGQMIMRDLIDKGHAAKSRSYAGIQGQTTLQELPKSAERGMPF